MLTASWTTEVLSNPDAKQNQQKSQHKNHYVKDFISFSIIQIYSIQQ